MKKILLTALGLTLLVAPLARALSAADVEAYLNGMSTYAASFQQLDSQGNFAQGQFFLKRPHKLLWEYDSGHKIISTGTKMFYIDGTTEQATQLPMQSGLPSLLVRKTVSLTDNPYFAAPELVEEGGWAVLRLRASGEDLSGATPHQVELVFTTQPLSLKRMVTLSEMGERVSVTFSNITEGGAVSDALFHYNYQDPFGS